jgi:hypothetical protein
MQRPFDRLVPQETWPAFHRLAHGPRTAARPPLEQRRNVLAGVVGKSGVLLSQPLPGSIQHLGAYA